MFYFFRPTQALETYWCAWKPYFNANTNKSNCIVNDHPTVVALHVLLERVLQLPDSVGTQQQRSGWVCFTFPELATCFGLTAVVFWLDSSRVLA